MITTRDQVLARNDSMTREANSLGLTIRFDPIVQAI